MTGPRSRRGRTGSPGSCSRCPPSRPDPGAGPRQRRRSDARYRWGVAERGGRASLLLGAWASGVFVAMWTGAVLAMLGNGAILMEAWAWLGSLGPVAAVVVWILFLPVCIGLWATQAGLAMPALFAVIALLVAEPRWRGLASPARRPRGAGETGGRDGADAVVDEPTGRGHARHMTTRRISALYRRGPDGRALHRRNAGCWDLPDRHRAGCRRRPAGPHRVPRPRRRVRRHDRPSTSVTTGASASGR